MFSLLLAGLITVSVPIVDVHRAPVLDKPVVTQAPYGSALEKLDEQGDWLKVRMEDGYLGWVPAKSVGVYAERGDTRVQALCAFVYREPDLKSQAPILALPFGSVLQVLRVQPNGWVEVALLDGAVGWVQELDLVLEQKKISREEMLELGLRFIGVPYRWGGTSSFGIDCSGLAQLLYRQRGIFIPRDSYLQSEDPQAEHIDPSGLEAGDLIFFEGHVGIALGEGKMLHATPPCVRIDPIDVRPVRCVRRWRG